MKIKTYLAIIQINDEIITMLRNGKNRNCVKMDIIDLMRNFYLIKKNKMIRSKDIQIILVRVEYYDGDYIVV